MKYIITEEQNERIIKTIKSIADTFTNEYIDKTDVEVETKYDSVGEMYYVLFPIFYLNEKGQNSGDGRKRLFKHELSDFVESVVGLPIHSYPARIKF